MTDTTTLNLDHNIMLERLQNQHLHFAFNYDNINNILLGKMYILYFYKLSIETQ